MVLQWEDFSIDLTTNDIFFDSKGDIAVNYLTGITDNQRMNQLTIDIYHQIKSYEFAIMSLDSIPEKINYIKNLFVNDYRIWDFDVKIENDNINIENIILRT